ncbi:pertactin-like passenger domain-containing protein, partial [Yoonia sp. R2-816]|uniref:pertactin-like passenger domain-containing protein n=1 Tax=Yoonia sp. R2-816 TaxID=3342638 RepID=UPI003726D4B5
MTNQYSDAQPAFRPLNVSVQGGRLTKFKGRVASIAPGLLVLTTAAALLAGGANQAVAQACGTPVNGQVTCDAGDNTDNGVTYDAGGTDDFSLVLDDPAMTVRGSGVRVQGTNESTGDISVNLENGEVSTSDGEARAIWVETVGRGGVTAQMDGGTITTNGGNAYGLWAHVNNTNTDQATRNEAEAKAVIAGGAIITTNESGHGLLADNKGFGDATAEMSGGAITTNGDTAYGLWAMVGQDQSDANATAIVTDGEGITTRGADSYALHAVNKGVGAATAELRNSAVATGGANARGLSAFTANSNSTNLATAKVIDGDVITHGRLAYGVWALTGSLGGALVSIEGSTVTTYGEGAEGLWAELHRNDDVAAENTATSEAHVIDGHVTTHGYAANAVFATHNGSGDSIVRAVDDTTITTYGDQSHGLAASGYSANKGIVYLGAGTVVSVHGEGAHGIHAEGGAGFDVDVAGFVTGGAKAEIVANTDGAAIRTISSAGGTIDITSTGWVAAGRSGLAIVDGNGFAVINSAGTIRGDIRLGAGNDILNLTGGSFAGNLDAGAGDDTVTISAATEYDGSYILDGGAGDDRLTLSGQTITTSENLLNWESVTLDDTTLNVDGMDRLDMGLSIDATSTFRATGREGRTPTGAMIAGQVATASSGGLTIAGDVINDGSVILDVQDGAVGDVITIDGDYTGSGSSLFALDTVIDGNGADTDQLVITGDISGEMVLSLAGLGNAGAEGGPLAIYLVSVGGESNGTFTLMDGNYVMADGEHGVIAGAHLYRLAEVEVEAQDGGSSNWWALSARSESGEVTYQPSAPIYDSYGASLLAFNAPSGLHARGSAQDFRTLAWGGAGADTPSDAADQDTGSPLWIQMGTEQLTASEEHSTTGAALE